MRNDPELWVTRELLRFCATREQAQDALRLMEQHGATPAEIADLWVEWEKHHDASVTVLYSSEGMASA